MNRFRLIMFGAEIAGVTIAFFSSAMPTQAKQCSAERPSDAQSYWSYRLIDGRKCWYEGKPMLSKSLLHWTASSRAVPANPRPSSGSESAKPRNALDAQASISDGDTTEPNPQANPKIVASPVPRATLTTDDLQAWGQSKVASITAEPVVMTILNRWPDQELTQHQAKPTPVGEPLLMSTRAMMVAVIIVMGLMAVLIEVTFHRRPRRQW
jgi:hypothetical protein